MPKPSNRFLELRTQFSAKAENCGLGRNRTCSLRGYNPVPYLMASNPFCEAKSLFTHSPTHTDHRCSSVRRSVSFEWLHCAAAGGRLELPIPSSGTTCFQDRPLVQPDARYLAQPNPSLLTLSLTLKPYMVYFSVRMSVRVKKRLRRGGRCGFRTRAPAFTDDLISSQAQ